MTEIAKLRALHEAATKGPWFVHDFADLAVCEGTPGPHDVTISCSTPDHIEVAGMSLGLTATLVEARANAAFIAAAHNQMGRLLAVCEAAGAVFNLSSAREYHERMIALHNALKALQSTVAP